MTTYWHNLCPRCRQEGQRDLRVGGEMTRVYTYKGIPKSQGRPRAVRAGKFVRIHEDPKDTENKNNIRAQIVSQNPEFHKEAAIGVSIICMFTRPKAHYNKSGLSKSAPVHHTQTPDTENLAKPVLDALKGVCWRDDSQVVDLQVLKMWTEGEPRTTIEVRGIF